MKIINRVTPQVYIFDRILQKDNLEKVNINDGEIVQYTGIYYKPDPNNSLNKTQIETTFIGKIVTDRGVEGNITTGIYIKPLYILNIISGEWNIIINYKEPTYKSYFLYPHLLMLPEYTYHYCPLFFLHTCEKCLIDYGNITTEFDLQN